MSILNIVAKGGILIIPIILCSLIAIGILIERLVTLRKFRINSRTFIMQIRNLLVKGQITEAVMQCKRTPGPIAKISKAAVEKYNRPHQEIRDAIESAGKMEIYLLEKNLGVLGTIAAIAPLLGFLGTVTGMIKAFMRIQMLGGNVDANVLAGGIWEALVTTAAGLAVGIPALIFYNWLQSKVEQFVFEMEDSSNALIDILHERGGSGRDLSNES
ncbi:MotA/TolQ/ExbB proton channel family protein [candidate division KSB1 bacterium]|nr:MotA/TolQ/ExbB proton channel family protein [candidate division KSB1 bacterium]